VSGYPDAPECDRLAAVAGESQQIGDFLDWLEERGIHLAQWVTPDGYVEPRLVTVDRSFTQILADYFDIDLAKVERERRAILTHLRTTKVAP